jgi:hypothetical protein
VYILTPGGDAFDTLGVVTATQTPGLTNFLQSCASRLNTKPGPTLVRPKAQSVAPVSGPGSRVFHVVSRGSNIGSWREFPAENWITLTPAECLKMLPPGDASVGTTWTLDAQIARKLLTNFYPQTEETDSTDRNQFVQQKLQLEVISSDGKLATARVDGQLVMKRSFYPGRNDLETIRASLIGFVTFEPQSRKLESVQLVTEKAYFGPEEFATALRSVAPSEH